MADDRPVAEQVMDHLQEALTARLRLADDENLEGVAIVTARDLQEVFTADYPADYSHFAELETPARLRVDMLCPNCQQVIPDVSAHLDAIQSRESPGGPSKVRLKLTAKTMNHVCGQQPLPRPADPEVEGQVSMDEAALDDEEAALREAEDAEDEAIERLESQPALAEFENDEVAGRIASEALDDADIAPPKKGRKS